MFCNCLLHHWTNDEIIFLLFHISFISMSLSLLEKALSEIWRMNFLASLSSPFSSTSSRSLTSLQSFYMIMIAMLSNVQPDMMCCCCLVSTIWLFFICFRAKLRVFASPAIITWKEFADYSQCCSRSLCFYKTKIAFKNSQAKVDVINAKSVFEEVQKNIFPDQPISWMRNITICFSKDNFSYYKKGGDFDFLHE